MIGDGSDVAQRGTTVPPPAGGWMVKRRDRRDFARGSKCFAYSPHVARTGNRNGSVRKTDWSGSNQNCCRKKAQETQNGFEQGGLRPALAFPALFCGQVWLRLIWQLPQAGFLQLRV